MIFCDAGKISSRGKTKEGFLIVDALAGRAGIQEYSPADLGAGVPKGLKGLKTIKLLRPESEVLKPESIASFKMKSVTIGHPPKLLTSETVRAHQAGVIQDIYAEGSDLKTRLIVQDATAVSAVSAGMEQVSLGYNADIDWVSGTDEVHGAYDGQMKNIIGNHIAIVDGITFSGRAGSKYRLLDAMATKKQETEMAEINDALTAANAAVNDARAEVVTLKQQLMDSEKKLAEVAAELVTTKNATITDAEIAVQVEAGVKALVEVIDAARVSCPKLETEGKSVTEIQLAVIDSLTGGQSTPDASDPVLVASVFDAVRKVSASKTEQINDALNTGGVSNTGSDAARDRMRARKSGKQE